MHVDIQVSGGESVETTRAVRVTYVHTYTTSDRSASSLDSRTDARQQVLIEDGAELKRATMMRAEFIIIISSSISSSSVPIRVL